ncbi:MAG: aromatic ring-hydroxylating dioxygenase subunit alpha [Pirellulaceae bacterium]
MSSGIEGDCHRQLMELIASRQPGWGLPRELYLQDLVYESELERIWREDWLFVGHTCEFPEPGDYLTFSVDQDSIVVIRGDDSVARAFYNFCRHRGTLLCDQATGHVGRVVCPYHQWTFARDGHLVSCRGMHDDVDRGELSLLSAHVQEVEGLVFVSLAKGQPPDFEPMRIACGPLLKPQGFSRAKVAKVVEYEVPANWKIVWENNRECYHCNVGHPQYIRANFDHYNADDATPAIRQRIADAVARSETKWAAAGLAVSHTQTGMCPFPSPGPHGWFAANRTALTEGYVSETMDGKQKAPLMGDYPDADVGTLRIRTMPNFWNHSSCDHGVSTRLLPAGKSQTNIRVTWLVEGNAQEGHDYQLADIMPFWQLTSEQDWELCRKVQQGVSSSRYRPGPFSTYKEYNVDAFVTWCLQRLAGDGTGGEQQGGAI